MDTRSCRRSTRRRVFGALLWILAAAVVPADASDPRYYDSGTPTLTEIWVDPVTGSDAASGASRGQALATLTEAWGRIPVAAPLAGTGYRILLVAGTYSPAIVPVYMESRWGTFEFPIVIEAADGAGTALLPALNIFDCRYLYLLGLDIRAGGGDILHCEACDHFLLRDSIVRGAAPATFAVQETVKINQSSHVYLEDNEISGAWDNAVDFVAVQYGHVQGNEIHDSGDWCLYAKGGSAYLRIEGNEVHDCGNGGITAGQGTGFEFMTSPWIHYEAYDLRIVNNLVHDTTGAGLGVNGGYDIVLAYNTLYRVGANSHVLEVVFGERGCDGDTSTCSALLSAGGWGTTSGTAEPIGDRNVYVYNNLVYNPSGAGSRWQHLAVYGPRATSPASNIPSPARTDTNLQIRGNIVWNGPVSHPLGIEDPGEGCQASNPTCNAAQLVADNAFNVAEPQLVNAAGGDFRPAPGGNMYAATTYGLPSFPGDDRPNPPLAPSGELAIEVTRDFTGAPRGVASPPGAFGADCSAAVCGDGTVTTGCELCDDGNVADGDGCDGNCTPTACGNAVVTAGEACDDGNPTAGDGCDPDCSLSACGNGVLAPDEQCDDGNLIDGDGCSAACALDCPTLPDTGCAEALRPGASKLALKDKPGTSADKLQWKLKGAAGAGAADFGDPLGPDAYVLCLWDHHGGVPSLALEARLPTAAECGAPGCWSTTGDGVRLADDLAGKLSLSLRSRDGLQADLKLVAKGPALALPSLPLAQDPRTTIELRASTGACWSARFSAPAGASNATGFKDKSD